MDYEKIKAFITIAESGTISEAAEKLYVSQPALTYQVKALEREVGVKLLNRGKGIHANELTLAGEAFVGMAKQLLGQWDEIRGTLELMASQDRMSVATLMSIGGFMLDGFCEDFIAAFPGGSVYLNVVSPDSLYDEIHARKYDIGITYKYSNSESVVYTPIATERFVFVCRKDSGYPERIEVGKLNPRKEIFQYWSQEFSLWHDKVYGVNGHYVETAGSIFHIKYLFGGFRDWAILPESVYRGLGEAFRICACDELPQDRHIYMMWKKGAEKETEYRQCARMLKGALAEMEGCFQIIE